MEWMSREDGYLRDILLDEVGPAHSR